MGPGGEYDLVPYPGHPFPQTHPDRLATVATLLGLRPPAVARCRVLELGCGDGGNLVPMALGLPGATFAGVDLAAGAVARGRALAGALGLGNVAFEEADIAGFVPAAGGFDYVIAHGVYSWVPARVRDALLAACRTALSPHGVAFVSYSALPGARLRQALRDMLRFRTAAVEAPAERPAAARSLLRELLAGWPDALEFGQALRPEAERLLERTDAGLYHDDLADVNEPVLFHEFAAHAARHGLAYLGEADFFEMDAGGEDADDPIVREQYSDFLKGRSFRQTLLCRAGVPVARRADAGAVAGMAVTSTLARTGAAGPDGTVTFATSRGSSLATDHPAVVDALERARRAWPAAVPVAELPDRDAAAEDRGVVCEALLRCYAADLVELHVEPPRLAARPGPRPQASPLARLQAAAGPDVTSLRHTSVRIDDAAGRHLVTLLDGTRDRAALTAEMRAHLVGGGDAAPEVEAHLERGLTRLAELGLLAA